MSTWYRFVLLLAIVLAVAVAPLIITDPYFRYVLVICGIYSIYAVALDLVVGYVGIDSFGHAAFFGCGAYTSGTLMFHIGLPFWSTIPLAMLLSGLLGVCISVPALRLRGVYFAMTTLAAAEIVRLVVMNWPSVTRGMLGLTVPTPEMPFVEPGDEVIVFYYLTFACLIAVCILCRLFIRTPVGRAVIAIRENEDLAAAVGIPAFRLKSGVFVASAMLSGLAGAIYAPFVSILSPDVLSVNYSALGLLMVIVGGKGTIYGALIGAFMFSVVTEAFRVASDLRMIVFSLLLILSIIFMPQGIAGLLQGVPGWPQRWLSLLVGRRAP